MAGLPATNPLANAGVNALSGISLPAVPPGHVNFAVVGREHRRKRKLAALREQSVSDVTLVELGEAVARVVAAANQAAGPLAAPPWFAAAINPITIRLDTVTTQLDTLSLQMFNMRRSARNASALLHFGSGAHGQPMEMLGKETPGFGPLPAGLALAPAVGAFFALPPPPLWPPALPPAQLPQVPYTGTTLSDDDVQVLSIFYNDTFRIVAGDSNVVQNEKLKAFLAGR
jgi:hypothetical protein